MKTQQEYLELGIQKLKEEIEEPNLSYILNFVKDCSIRKVGPSRLREYVRVLHSMMKMLGKDAKTATREDITNILYEIETAKGHYACRGKKRVWIDRPYSQGYIGFHKIAIKRFYQFLFEMEKGEYPKQVSHIETVPTNGVSVTPDDVLTIEEVKKLAESCDNARDRAVFWVFFEAGARVNELIPLKKTDIIWDEYGAKIRVRTEKMKRGEREIKKDKIREIRLVASAPALSEWVKNVPGEYVWVGLSSSSKGKLLTQHGINSILKRAARRAGIKKRVYPHLLRHSGCTFDAARGMPKAVADKKYGWAERSRMFDHYTSMSSAQVDDVILRLSGIEKKRDKQKEIIQICPRCKVKNTPSNFCSACAFPLNNEAAAKALEKKQAVESFLDMAVQKYPGVLEMLEKIAQKETIKMEV